MLRQTYKRLGRLSLQQYHFQIPIQKIYKYSNHLENLQKVNINLNFFNFKPLFFYSTIQYAGKDKEQEYSDDFLSQLMLKNIVKNSILKIGDKLINDYQKIKGQKQNFKDYSAQNQQPLQNQNKQIKKQSYPKTLKKNQNNQKITFIKIKFLAYVYHLYPNQININIIDFMINQYLMSKIQEIQNQNYFQMINDFQGFLKLMYQSQFFKGNYQKIRRSLASYIQYLLKCSKIMLKQFHIQIQKIKNGVQNQQGKRNLEKIVQNYRKLIFAFPFCKVQTKKQSTQQKQLIMILNQPYLKVISQFFELVKTFNTTWVKKPFQSTNLEIESINLNSLVRESFRQNTKIYKCLTETISIIVQHQYELKKNLNQFIKNDQNIKNYNSNTDIFDFQPSIIFDQETLVCKNDVQFARVLHLLEHFMSFSLVRKVNLKKVNNFYKQFFKINLNKNSKIGKNQKTKILIWNHLSMHSLYLNFDIENQLKLNQIQINSIVK